MLLVLKEANYMSLERGFAYLLMRMIEEEDEGDDGETLEPWGKHRKLLEALAWLVEEWGRRSREVVEKRRNEIKWGKGVLGFQKRVFF